MSTLDECKRCGMIYEVSGFYVAGEGSTYSPEFNQWDDRTGFALDQLGQYWKLLSAEARGYWCSSCLAQGLREAVAARYALLRAPFWYHLVASVKNNLEYDNYKFRLMHFLWDLRKDLRWGGAEILTGEVPDKTPPAVQRITWPWEKELPPWNPPIKSQP